MLIVLNIDPKLLAELLVTASLARSKSLSGRGRPVAAEQEREPVRPDRGPGRPDSGRRTGHARVAG